MITPNMDKDTRQRMTKERARDLLAQAFSDAGGNKVFEEGSDTINKLHEIAIAAITQALTESSEKTLHPERRELIANMRLASVASCNCGAKTYELSFHDTTCRFRCLEEAADALENDAESSGQMDEEAPAILRTLASVPDSADISETDAKVSVGLLRRLLTSGQGTDRACCEGMRENALEIVAKDHGGFGWKRRIREAIHALPLPVSAEGRDAVIEPTDEMVMAAADFCSRCDSDECGWLGCSRNQLRAALNLKSKQPSDTGAGK